MKSIDKLITYLYNCKDSPNEWNFKSIRNKYSDTERDEKIFLLSKKALDKIAQIKGNDDWRSDFFNIILNRIEQDISDVITTRGFYKERFKQEKQRYIKDVLDCSVNAKDYLKKEPNGATEEEVMGILIRIAQGDFVLLNRAKGDEELGEKYDKFFGVGVWSLLGNYYLSYEYFRAVYNTFNGALNYSCSLRDDNPFLGEGGLDDSPQRISRDEVFIKYWTLREHAGMSVKAAYKKIEMLLLREFGNKDSVKNNLNLTLSVDSFPRLARKYRHLYYRE